MRWSLDWVLIGEVVAEGIRRKGNAEDLIPEDFKAGAEKGLVCGRLDYIARRRASRTREASTARRINPAGPTPLSKYVSREASPQG